jgi:hypothetical protein
MIKFIFFFQLHSFLPFSFSTLFLLLTLLTCEDAETPVPFLKVIITLSVRCITSQVFRPENENGSHERRNGLPGSDLGSDSHVVADCRFAHCRKS